MNYFKKTIIALWIIYIIYNVIWLGGYINPKINKDLSINGKLALGEVVNISKSYKTTREDYDIEYFVGGIRYVEQSSNIDDKLELGELVWVLYNEKKPEEAQAFYYLFDQYAGQNEYLDTTKRYNEMENYLDSCKCVPDSFKYFYY